MRKNYFIILFILLLVIIPLYQSCINNSGKIVEFDSFSIEKNLIAHEANWINNNSNLHMQIFDSILLVIDMYNEHYFYFYNINSQKLLTSFGKKGKGPDEFFNIPEVLDFYRAEENEIYFYLVDQAKRGIIEVKLLTSIKSNKIVSNEIIEFSYKIPGIFLYKLNDSIYAGSGEDNRGSLFLYNIKRDSIIKWQKRTKIKGYGYIYLDNKLNGSQEYIKVSPDRKKIVSRFYFLKRIHIYDNKGDIITIIQDKNKGGLDFSSPHVSSKNNDRYRLSILSNEFFLIVNSSLPSNRDRNKGQQIMEILIFNYSGKAVAKYKLDRLGFVFTMDWKMNRLYTYDDENGEFIYYNLTGFY